MQPININQEGTILSGHGRAMKLKQMGETEVDVYVPDRMLTPKQEEEVLVRANANTAGWNNGLKNVNYSKCLEFGRDNSEAHPTIKPIDLISNEIQISSNKNSLVLDFFLGSGSTMVASQQLKRKCYGMELDPKYCDVIIRRMIKLDPSLKITRNGEDCKQEFIEKNA